MPGPTTWTRELLEEHLKGAVELELTTIPPYLTALYSLKPGSNAKAAELIWSVVFEEMLHLALAANVLNAIGGEPEVTGEFTPRYPAKLPFHTPASFEVGLERFSEEALDTFMAIENPNHPEVANVAAASSEAVPTRAYLLAQQYEYKTIGEFYGAIEEGLRALDDGSLFVGKESRQITPDAYHGGKGKGHIVIVTEINTAVEALEEIVEQGEGDTKISGPADKYDGEGELAHYYRFQELALGKEYREQDQPGKPEGPSIAIDFDAVFPMRKNLKAEKLSGEVRKKVEEFNELYSGLVREIQKGIGGEPAALDPAIGTMFELPKAIQALMEMPIGDGSNENAGPTFEYRP